MTKKRFRLYLETSFWRRLADDASDVRRKASFAFLQQIRGRHDVVVSRLVYDEIRFTTSRDQRKAVLRRLDSVRAKVLAINAEVRELTEFLLREGGWSDDNRADMTHLACAILHGSDALVTWDRKDLAKDKVRGIVEKWARNHGRPKTHVGLPEDVATWLRIE